GGGGGRRGGRAGGRPIAAVGGGGGGGWLPAGPPPRSPAVACSAAGLARATSVTCTKSRRWPPSSNTVGAWPRSSADRKIAATPLYGVSRGIPGPYTLW